MICCADDDITFRFRRFASYFFRYFRYFRTRFIFSRRRFARLRRLIYHFLRRRCLRHAYAASPCRH